MTLTLGGQTYKFCPKHKVRFNASTSEKCSLCLNPLISHYPVKVGKRDPIYQTDKSTDLSPHQIKNKG